MNSIEIFYLLKQKILDKYRGQYPYFTGTIHDFGNREIAQLLDMIEQECKERVSEKWVYTHLKPIQNEKLPRKDILDIFSRWLGYSGWEEFVYQNNKPDTAAIKDDNKKNSPLKKRFYMTLGVFIVLLATGIGFNINTDYEARICLNDKYTQKTIETDKVTLYLLLNNEKQKLQRENNCFILKSNTPKARLVVESPYYKADTLTINFENNNSDSYEYDLQPDDYAMMLRAYMNANINDWNRRKQHLNDILDDNAIIQEVMFEDIGVEFLNKQEFINKITTPSKMVKKMEVVAIEYKDGKIVSLKYMQKK